MSHKEALYIKKPYVYVNCTVVNIPEKFANSSKFSCFVIDSDVEKLKKKKIYVISKLKDIHVFDEIAFIGKVKEKNKKIYLFPFTDFLKIKKSSISSIFSVRDKLIHNYEKNSLSSTSFSIGKALIFGERDLLSENTKRIFVETGLIHLLAISGLHIGLIVFVVIILIRSQNIRNKILLFLLPFYAIYTGFHIPVVRASFMGFLYFLGKSKGIKVDPVNILFFVAFVIIVVSPDTLFSVGFQLSFIATLGILLSLNFISVSFFKSRILNFPIQSFLTSLVATIFTLPVVLYYFHAFSPVSLFATTVAVIPLTVFIGFSVFNLVTGFYIELLVKFMDLFGVLFLNIVDFFHFETGYVKGFSPDLITVVTFIGIFIGISLLRINFFSKFTLFVLSAFIFLFLSYDRFSGYRLYVFEGEKKPKLVICKKKEFCILVSEYPDYRIKSVLNLEMPEKILVLSKYSDRFLSSEYNILDDENCYTDICIKQYKDHYIVYLDSKKIFIKNSTYIYELEKK